ncbi:MAG: T9SS type A sorting domain-containing protein [Bacteroidetes bacterium]|nr:T9SS type A sorting domain-containing protein [Bacteroidota bacterium]
MKKVLLALSFVVCCSLSFGQNLKITDTSGNVLNSDTLFLADTPGVYQVIAHLVVINEGASTYNVYCKKDTLSLVPGSTNDFCWAGLCYPASTYISSASLAMAPSDTSTEFSTHYRPYDNNGTSLIRYVFFSSAPSNHDTVYVSYTVDVQQDEQDIISKENVNFSSPYPNPAGTFTQFNISFPDNSNALILVYNILGKQILNTPVRSSGTIRLNTSTLTRGVYFCSLIVDGKTIATRKLVKK